MARTFEDKKAAKKLGSIGGTKSGESRRRRKVAPTVYEGTPLDLMTAAGLVGGTWDPWRTVVRAAYGLPMDDVDRERFHRHTGGRAVPPGPVSELWLIAGRRSGKSRIASVLATHRAITVDYSTILAAGEVATVGTISSDRKQALGLQRYGRGLAKLPEVAPFVGRVLKDAIEYTTSAHLEIHSCSYRAVRGFSVAGAVMDEVAYWRDETSANPDSEVIGSLTPGMSNVPGSMLVAISSPHARRGALYNAYAAHWGQDTPDVLIWCADSLTMNPSLSASVVRRAFERDPISAVSEYGDHESGLVLFRSDISPFVSPEAVAAVTVQGRRELPPIEGISYSGFCDPSGGSSDSFTAAVGHIENGVAILDAVREIHAPFDPSTATAELAGLLKRYRIKRIRGDKYAGSWPSSEFAKHGIEYVASEETKSELYIEVLPLVNARQVELLDLQVLRTQLLGLERRTARSGRESVDHGVGARDDLSNSVAGVLVNVHARRAGASLEGVTSLGSELFVQDSWYGMFENTDGF